MPIHDWTRSSDAAFHSFHLDWNAQISSALNVGGLPSPCYSIAEVLELRPTPALLQLEEPDGPLVRSTWEEDLLVASEAVPRARLKVFDDRRQYASPIITVRDDLHQPTAAVMLATWQDKTTPYRLDRIVELAVGMLSRGIHLLIVDLFPPSKRDPQGIHKLIWDRIKDEPYELPPGKPLTIAAYSAGGVITAYVDNVGVGDPLPDMPIFLTPDRYVPCPLESTYQASWNVFPKALKEPLELPPG